MNHWIPSSAAVIILTRLYNRDELPNARASVGTVQSNDDGCSFFIRDTRVPLTCLSRDSPWKNICSIRVTDLLLSGDSNRIIGFYEPKYFSVGSFLFDRLVSVISNQSFHTNVQTNFSDRDNKRYRSLTLSFRLNFILLHKLKFFPARRSDTRPVFIGVSYLGIRGELDCTLRENI